MSEPSTRIFVFSQNYKGHKVTSCKRRFWVSWTGGYIQLLYIYIEKWKVRRSTEIILSNYKYLVTTKHSIGCRYYGILHQVKLFLDLQRYYTTTVLFVTSTSPFSRHLAFHISQNWVPLPKLLSIHPLPEPWSSVSQLVGGLFQPIWFQPSWWLLIRLMVSSHLKNVSQISSFPRFSGWKYVETTNFHPYNRDPD